MTARKSSRFKPFQIGFIVLALGAFATACASKQPVNHAAAQCSENCAPIEGLHGRFED